MPKLCKRRATLQHHASATSTLPNLTAAPRKVSFESSEGDISFSCTSPTHEQPPPRLPVSSSSPRRRRKNERTALRRPSTSFSLSSMVMTPTPSRSCDSSPRSASSEDSNSSGYAWGQFVDVIPPNSPGDDHASNSEVFHTSATLSELSKNCHEPYRRGRRLQRRPLKQGAHNSDKGFLPGFVLSIPVSPKREQCDDSSELVTQQEEHTTSDFITAMKRMQV